MNKKLNIHIVNRKFEVDVDGEFALFLRAQASKDFNMEGNNDIKTLLQAYVKKNHELFIQEQEIKNILKKLDDL
jgi:DNA-binding transcriptional regulator YhcF (GntR family)